MKFFMRFFILLISFICLAQPENIFAQMENQHENFLKKDDAVLLADPDGKIILSKNAGKKLIPASTLKILTCLAAFHYLGEDFRFRTEFYLDNDSNLKVKGYGDPLLMSECLIKITEVLGERLGRETGKIKSIVLDGSFFSYPVVISGISSSFEPYDAPNGALCVNFNTVCFKKPDNFKEPGNLKKPGGTPDRKYVSAEPQTPLLPFIQERICKSGLSRGRIVLSRQGNECTLYAGRLLNYFLKGQGIKTDDSIVAGKINKETDRLVYTYASMFSLEQVVKKLFKYSNNFMANQLLLSIGAQVYGPPATIKKGVDAVLDYTKNMLKTKDLVFVEGSGISRQNTVSAKAMDKILKAFEPFHNLMRHEDGVFFKTGTLKGIRTRAGYIENRKGNLYRFVVFMNTPADSREESMKQIMDILCELVNGRD